MYLGNFFMKQIAHIVSKSVSVILLALLILLSVDSPAVRAIDRDEFDTAVKPGDDFFQYINGKWIKKNPIPAEYSRWGVFAEIRDRNLTTLHDILDGLTRQTEGLTDERRKLRDLYLTATDEAALEKQGAATLTTECEQIAKVGSAEDLVALIADFRSRGLDFVFDLLRRAG